MERRWRLGIFQLYFPKVNSTNSILKYYLKAGDGFKTEICVITQFRKQLNNNLTILNDEEDQTKIRT